MLATRPQEKPLALTMLSNAASLLASPPGPRPSLAKSPEASTPAQETSPSPRDSPPRYVQPPPQQFRSRRRNSICLGSPDDVASRLVPAKAPISSPLQFFASSAPHTSHLQHRRGSSDLSVHGKHMSPPSPVRHGFYQEEFQPRQQMRVGYYGRPQYSGRPRGFTPLPSAFPPSPFDGGSAPRYARRLSVEEENCARGFLSFASSLKQRQAEDFRAYRRGSAPASLLPPPQSLPKPSPRKRKAERASSARKTRTRASFQLPHAAAELPRRSRSLSGFSTQALKVPRTFEQFKPHLHKIQDSLALECGVVKSTISKAWKKASRLKYGAPQRWPARRVKAKHPKLTDPKAYLAAIEVVEEVDPVEGSPEELEQSLLALKRGRRASVPSLKR